MPTAPAGTNTTQAASTAFVKGAVDNATSGALTPESVTIAGNVTLVSETNPTVNVLQFGEDGSGVLKEQHITTADQTGTGEGAKLVFNPGMSNGADQAAASVTIATGRATGTGGGGTGAGGYIRFSTSDVTAGSTDVNSTATRWEIAGTGVLQPGGDNLYNIGTAALRPGSMFLATSVRIGSNVASSGAIRLGNASIIAARNAANSADIQIAQVTAGDVVVLGSGQTFVQVPGLRFGSVSTPSILTGTGTPEGAVSARIGSIFMRQDGGAGTSIYVKESGTGTTGWVAK